MTKDLFNVHLPRVSVLTCTPLALLVNLMLFMNVSSSYAQGEIVIGIEDLVGKSQSTVHYQSISHANRAKGVVASQQSTFNSNGNHFKQEGNYHQNVNWTHPSNQAIRVDNSNWWMAFLSWFSTMLH